MDYIFHDSFQLAVQNRWCWSDFKFISQLGMLCIGLDYLPVCYVCVAGEMDFLKPYGLELLEHCEDASVIHHPKGHTVPRLDEKGLETMMSFIDKIQKILAEKDQH